MASVSRQHRCHRRYHSACWGVEYHCPVEEPTRDWRLRTLPPAIVGLGSPARAVAVPAPSE